MIVKIKIFPDIPLLDNMASEVKGLMVGLIVQALGKNTIFSKNRNGPPETHSRLLIEGGRYYFIPTVNLLGVAFEEQRGPLYGALSGVLSIPEELPGLVLAPDDVEVLVGSPESGYSFLEEITVLTH